MGVVAHRGGGQLRGPFKIQSSVEKCSLRGRQHIKTKNKLEQGHHHNGDQAAGRPHMTCSICGRWFTTPVWGTWGLGWAHSVARPCIPIGSPLIHMIYLLPFSSYLAGSKSVSAPRPRYDDKYGSRSHHFVDRQKLRRWCDRRPQKNKGKTCKGIANPLTIISKLGSSPSRKLYEISVSQMARECHVWSVSTRCESHGFTPTQFIPRCLSGAWAAELT